MYYDDLVQLDELRKRGAISEEEYEREKQRLFNRYDHSHTSSSSSNPLLGLSENSYVALMHISQFAGFLLPGLGFVAPVILWVINKDNNERVNSVGKHILNFMISMLLYFVASGVLCFLLIGIPMLIALGITQIVCIIIATIKAKNGEAWRYPLTIDFLK